MESLWSWQIHSPMFLWAWKGAHWIEKCHGQEQNVIEIYWMLQGGAYTNNRNFVNQPQQQQQQQVQVVQRQSPGQQLPPVRSLTSPGARGSPFSPEGQYPRLTRTISAPPPAPHATTQLPGNPPNSPCHACQ